MYITRQDGVCMYVWEQDNQRNKDNQRKAHITKDKDRIYT